MMGRRARVRVEFGLSPSLADDVYGYAKCEGLTLSQAGERLLAHGLSTVRAEPETDSRAR
ncbi:hypothetical protein BCA37_00175 [Mycobacterium sp. djl-10]|nr:hypothetical protein BCA37_00175 [Mycobacterium sp. djl-10]